jgi:hypothetical protein
LRPIVVCALQEGLMRTLLCLLVLGITGVANADVDVSGKWSGSFNITRDNGESKDSTAILVLKQNGAEITGTVGPTEDEQFTIKSGKIDAGKITLEVDEHGHALKFNLVLAADRITGEANMSGENGETAKAKLDVTRAK